MGDLLATPSDLASLLQQDLDTATATLVLEMATGIVQAVTGQRIVEVEDDEVDLVGDAGLWLDLPQRPVTAVSAVTLAGTAVTDFTVSSGRLWRSLGWLSTVDVAPAQPGVSPVAVTYTHGYPAGHQALQLGRSAVLSLAATVYANPGGATRVAIDDFSAAYEAMSSQMEASPFLVGALRRQYGRPGAGSVPLRAPGYGAFAR